jgi:hypothetical protein
MSATVSTAAELSGDKRWCTVSSMTEPLRLTIVYEDAGDGWVTARVAEVPGAISEGASRADAKKTSSMRSGASWSCDSVSTLSANQSRTANRLSS